MIDRRMLIAALAGGCLAAPFAAGAQTSEKVWRIGYLGVLPRGASPEGAKLIEAFLQMLRESGFVEGKNMVFEHRATEGRADRASALVAELIRLRADVLVVPTTVLVRAAKEATTTIPIVMVAVSDPVASGFVASLARPGGNITGMTDFEEDLYPKLLELLKAAAPRTGRVAFVQEDYTRRLDAAKLNALNKEHDAAAQSLGISLLRVSLNSP